MNKQELMDYVNELYAHLQTHFNNQEAKKALNKHGKAITALQGLYEMPSLAPPVGPATITLPQTDLHALLDVVETALKPKVTFKADNYDAMQQEASELRGMSLNTVRGCLRMFLNLRGD